MSTRTAARPQTQIANRDSPSHPHSPSLRSLPAPCMTRGERARQAFIIPQTLSDSVFCLHCKLAAECLLYSWQRGRPGSRGAAVIASLGRRLQRYNYNQFLYLSIRQLTTEGTACSRSRIIILTFTQFQPISIPVHLPTPPLFQALRIKSARNILFSPSLWAQHA